MTDDEIKRLRALCEAAAPGPCAPDEDYAALAGLGAVARSALPAALDEIERLRAALAAALWCEVCGG